MIYLAMPRITSGQTRVTTIVKTLGMNDSAKIYDKLAILEKASPDSSVKLLIAQLAPIKGITKIFPEEFSKYPKDLHVIWCIRALRYLTGLDFTAATKHVFRKDDSVRSQLLRVRGDQLSFFAVRMAHDVIYIAPIDTQEKIIMKWEKWYNDNIGRMKVVEPRDFNDWYF